MMDLLHWPHQTELRLAPLACIVAHTGVMNDGEVRAIGDIIIRFQPGLAIVMTIYNAARYSAGEPQMSSPT